MHALNGDHRRWRIEVRTASAAALHERWPAIDRDPEQASVALCRPDAPAVVLGSTQHETDIDAERASTMGIAVARRRSGGGAVLVTADDPVWIDFWVPTGHRLWRADVTRAFDWVGETWAAALGRAGIDGIAVHRGGPLLHTRWASKVCFGGTGAGEVATDEGRKVVGLAQRRTRAGSWFHSACLIRWTPGALVQLLALAPEDGEAAVGDLGSAAVGAADLADVAGHRHGPEATGGGEGSADHREVRPRVDHPSLWSALLASLP